MKKLNFLALGLILSVGFSQGQTYQNNTATEPVDGITRLGVCGGQTDPGVNMSLINVPLTGSIIDPSKITVNLSISANWLGDVAAELITPSGEAITLIRRIGALSITSCGDSSSFVAGNILGFNSANTSPIDHTAVGVGVAIPAGNYAPSYGTAKFPNHHPGVMSTFLNGKQLSGDWRLIIYDYGTTDPTILNSWQIIVGAGATLKSSETGTFGSEISIKQNPVDDYLMVDVTDDFKSLNLEIYDASGKRIKSESLLRNAKNIQLDVRNLAPGMYLLIPVKDGERKQAIKFIKK
ncbi:T9SS type A sorting domain-containing protein [Kaistella sp.]|uniref:T9SS type A sorting domain-containing protein n=1 Tax=Kaistella sp. TaxID=2782235 RepID=UPI00359F1F01